MLHLCDFRSEPQERECLEAVWSMGRSCKKCYRDTCHRQGWTKYQVDNDNSRRVAEKRRNNA